MSFLLNTYIKARNLSDGKLLPDASFYPRALHLFQPPAQRAP